MKVFRKAAMAMVAGFSAFTVMAVHAATKQPEQSQSVHDSQAADTSHLIWVRILPFVLRDKGWQLKEYNGQDVLRMIRELKPDVLERFITGKPNLDDKVPMGPGAAPMGFVNYLNAAMKAGAPGSFLTPKVHLNSIWSDEYRLAAAQGLHDLPVTPRLNTLDLDVYFTQGGAQDHEDTLKKFKAMGWKYLGFNFVGGANPVFGLGAFAMAGVNKHSWQVNQKELEFMKQQGIPTRLAHIDYPGAIGEFGKLSPDQQADIIQRISREQRQYGYTFVYPVLYGTQSYDASKEVTRSDGPYKGMTLFEIIKQDIQCDRQFPKPCSYRPTE